METALVTLSFCLFILGLCLLPSRRNLLLYGRNKQFWVSIAALTLSASLLIGAVSCS